MSNQIIYSDLIVDLSTQEQEILAGGKTCSPPVKSRRDQNGDDSPAEQEQNNEQDNGNGSKYRVLIYRPLVYRPTFDVKL
jgi:hypothetical protein